MEHSYFKITLKQVNTETVYMVRSDKVSEFFNNKIDYLSGDCSITVKVDSRHTKTVVNGL